MSISTNFILIEKIFLKLTLDRNQSLKWRQTHNLKFGFRFSAQERLMVASEPQPLPRGV